MVKEKGKLIWTIAISIAVVIAAYALFRMLVQTEPPAQVTQTALEQVANATEALK